MCPPFNLVFEETPHKFLYQERKTSLGEGCLSKRTDQTEWGRDRRTQTESSLAWTVKYMLFQLFYFAKFLLRSGHAAAPSAVSLSCMNRHSAWHFSGFPSQLLPFFPPRELHPFCLLPFLHSPRTSLLCPCIDAFGCVSSCLVFTCCVGPSLPSSP